MRNKSVSYLNVSRFAPKLGVCTHILYLYQDARSRGREKQRDGDKWHSTWGDDTPMPVAPRASVLVCLDTSLVLYGSSIYHLRSLEKAKN